MRWRDGSALRPRAAPSGRGRIWTICRSPVAGEGESAIIAVNGLMAALFRTVGLPVPSS